MWIMDLKSLNIMLIINALNIIIKINYFGSVLKLKNIDWVNYKLYMLFKVLDFII